MFIQYLQEGEKIYSFHFILLMVCFLN